MAARPIATTLGALLWTVAAVAYFAAEAVAAAGVPGYDYGSDYISSLGIPGRSPHAALMNAAFVVQGLLFATGAALVVRGVRAAPAAWFLAFAATNGAGNLLVAVVHSGSGSGWHPVGAVMAIAGGNAAIITGAVVLRRAGASRRYQAISIALGGLGLLCLVTMALDSPHVVASIGAWERGSVYAIFGWQVFTAAYVVGRRDAFS